MSDELILYSLANFRDLILPALELAGARRIVEIGSEYGGFTQHLCAYAQRTGGELVTVDPYPQEAAQKYIASRRGDRHFRFLQKTSEEALPLLDGVDAYIIDGDHNYYTVRRELELIYETRGQAPWLVFEHDVCWPWGHRDLYYAPQCIPSEFLHPHSNAGGVTLDEPGVVPWGFGNPKTMSIALAEGGPRNGVRPAIEEFVASHPELQFEVVPAIFGLGVIYSRAAPWAEQLEALLAPYTKNPLIAQMERNRVRLFLKVLEFFHRQTAAAKRPAATFLPGRKRLEVFPVSNRVEFEQLWTERLAQVVREHDALAPEKPQPFRLSGVCAVCGGEVEFNSDFQFASPDADGRLRPAWRERQICRCGLNCRQRSCFHILTDSLGLPPTAAVYCTEQQSLLFQLIRRVFPRAVGSEYLGPRATRGALSPAGIRHEDLARLTFPDAGFDCIASLDLLARVPDYRAGLREFARCLKPGGRLLLTVPLHFNQDKSVTRATLNPDGSVTHHLPPAYHGEPRDGQGTLCFHDFGWDLVASLREAGFPDATVQAFSAPHYGYVGLQYVILATRQQAVSECACGSVPAAKPAPHFNPSPVVPVKRQQNAVPAPPQELEEAVWQVEGRTYGN